MPGIQEEGNSSTKGMLPSCVGFGLLGPLEWVIHGNVQVLLDEGFGQSNHVVYSTSHIDNLTWHRHLDKKNKEKNFSPVSFLDSWEDSNLHALIQSRTKTWFPKQPIKIKTSKKKVKANAKWLSGREVSVELQPGKRVAWLLSPLFPIF